MKGADAGIMALKPLALKRKAVANNDKVRYRVYISPDEYIAVIAENALMALKISGVKVPYRILRDLPLTQNAVSRESLIPHHMQPTVFLKPEAPTVLQTSQFEAVSLKVDGEMKPFEPVDLGGLFAGKKHYASTIDVNDILNAMPGEVMPEGARVVSSDRLPSADPTTAQVTANVAEEEALPQSTPTENVLTPEEIERLLNEPRA